MFRQGRGERSTEGVTGAYRVNCFDRRCADPVNLSTGVDQASF
jgi:hypothetical protein